ncbi:MAG: relaxase/mobilization nuclease domain-containing protein [Tannerella sp.]|jgi:hypothetical protein|nr:relaxase/mobilization nuclease domain-containing protein [Tannerella sp.]
MVARINAGSSLFGALAYNQEKVEKDGAKVLFGNRIIQNTDGRYSMRNMMDSFKPYLDANNKTEKPILHISLNPHLDDKLSEEQLCEIAKKYMDRMGYGDQPYLVYKHEDIDRHHIHIVSVNVDGTGKKISNSNDFYKSKKITRELEKEYHLLPAEKQKDSQSLPLKPVDIKAGNVKQQVAGIVKSLMRDYRFQSINEYRALLNIYNVTVEEVKGEVRGKGYSGLVYSALDKNGEKRGNPFKASLIGRDAGYNALQKKIASSKKSMKEKAVYDRTKAIVSSCMKNNPSRKQFEKELAKNGISVLFRENDDKRIYGVTFTDHREKVVFNGSRLGKEFSANVFHELFNGNGRQDKHSIDNEKQFHTNNQDYQHGQDSAGEAIAGIFSMEQHGDNYEEIAFTNRMKRRKKKRRGYGL